MPNQKGLVHILVVLILLAGLAATLYLSQKTQIFKPKAVAPSGVEITSLAEEEKRIAGIDANPSAASNIVREQGEIPTTPPSAATLRPPNISSCGEITSSGDYILTQDITSQGTCINIHDTQNVTLDCQNHVIGSDRSPDYAPLPLNIKNVESFSIKNCKLQSPYSRSYGFIISNSSSGDVQNNTISKGQIWVENSNNLQIYNNYTDYLYLQLNSSFVNIHDNKFISNSQYYPVGAVVSLDNGGNNIIKDNVITGGWNGVLPDVTGGGLVLVDGTDDGIFFAGETKDIITGNTISNIYDCGIETARLIQDTQITKNKISNAGLCGIGGWYYNSWLHNTVDSNIVDGSAYMFYLFRAERTGENQECIFKDNTFNNNIFLNQKSASYIGFTRSYSALVDFQNLPQNISSSTLQLGNNVFKNNDFGENLPAPMLIPASMIVDQGGNKCLYIRDDITRPLNCSGLTVSPSPMVKCQTDSECGEGMRCQLPVCANPDPEQICREASDKAKCFAQVEQKARQRCTGRCVKASGF